MRTEPTIVTAFFDLHRGEWQNSGRTTKRYIESFAFWAGLKNKLVVYTNKEVAEEVKRIRAEKGLLEATTVIIVEDYLVLDSELLASIEAAMLQPASKMFHLRPEHPESWNARYNYVMLLKWWCVCDAIERNLTGETVAWIDFGFNNCGTLYTEPSEFDFVWTCDTDDKMNLFCINQPDETPVFEIVQKMETYVQGASLVGPARLWKPFSELVRNAVMAMNDVGFADDDQVYILMAYRKRPEMFKINKCTWFSIFQVTSERNFTLRPPIQELDFKSTLKKKLKQYEYRKTVNKYLKRQKEILLHRNTIND